MSTNLSQQKREKLLNNIKIMREKLNNNPELVQSLADIETELKRKKYGLIWEEHEEKVDEELKTKIPVFEEQKELEIKESDDKFFNFLLEGDNLHSLYLLEKTHRNKIDVIYIDPPYNTGNKNFVYDDKFVETEDSYKHSKWISFMEKRLKIAKNLLTAKGLIFISINYIEQAQLKLLCDEIFGENNLVGEITWESTTQPINSGSAKFGLQQKTEWILVYAKDINKKDAFLLNKIENKQKYPHIGKLGKCRFEIIEKSDAGGYKRETMKFKILGQEPREGKRWQIGKDRAEELIKNNRIEIVNGIVKVAVYPEDELGKVSYIPFWSHFQANEVGTAQNGKEELNNILNRAVGFDTVKPTKLIKEILSHFNKNITVLDFFAGSGTTAQAVLELNRNDNGNRKFILCTNNENNICRNITYERLKRIIKGYNDIKNNEIKGISANLKYYKTEYIDRFNHEDDAYYIVNELSKYIKELVQLENGLDIDDKSVQVLFTDEEVDNFSKSNDLVEKCKILYIDTNALITDEQIEKFEKNNITILYIPEYYFEEEIMEVEQW